MLKYYNHAAFAIVVPAVVGLLLAALGVYAANDYGWTLFLVVPFLISFLSAYFYSVGVVPRRKFAECYGIGLLSFLLVGLAMVLVAMEGVICLLMAFPLAMIVGSFGTIFGMSVARMREEAKPTIPLIAIALVPMLMSFESALPKPAPQLRQVSTEILINAPIERVWASVIAFPKIETPPGGIFRAGIAYPIEAEIVGEGVGAIRYCRFSTGDFVEPITRWEAPTHLAFDVRENPEPLKELSLYKHVHAPHLHGYMVSERGEFRLEASASGTRVTGTTWFRHHLDPQFYWGGISDVIIHKVHRRVLEHIRDVSEN